MSELDCITKADRPLTVDLLKEGLLGLGLSRGQTVIVHSSLKSLGWVCGGAEAVIVALMEVVGPEGTLVMPAHSSSNSDPTKWQCPPVPRDWWDIIKETMPAFNPQTTPTRGMGAIAEIFRSFPGVLRSYHPAVSFSAWGKNSSLITKDHALDFPLGDKSPLARIYDLDGHILLLGVDHDKNTSLHLAENRQKNIKVVTEASAILQKGVRLWQEYKEIDMNPDQFMQIGSDYEQIAQVRSGMIGQASCKLLPQKKLVDFATQWLNKVASHSV
ncbi:MAG: AAC(3) family N-acetyltransferase [Bacteriovoracaceae bacterium]|nr:AAC(3) family N-acetyltransferase [Bacteriovoracaceae bacterium]